MQEPMTTAVEGDGEEGEPRFQSQMVQEEYEKAVRALSN